MQGINQNVNAEIQRLFPNKEIKLSKGCVKVYENVVHSITIDQLSEFSFLNNDVEVTMKRSGLYIVIIFTDLNISVVEHNTQNSNSKYCALERANQDAH